MAIAKLPARCWIGDAVKHRLFDLNWPGGHKRIRRSRCYRAGVIVFDGWRLRRVGSRPALDALPRPCMYGFRSGSARVSAHFSARTRALLIRSGGGRARRYTAPPIRSALPHAGAGLRPAPPAPCLVRVGRGGDGAHRVRQHQPRPGCRRTAPPRPAGAAAARRMRWPRSLRRSPAARPCRVWRQADGAALHRPCARARSKRMRRHATGCPAAPTTCAGSRLPSRWWRSPL